MAKRIGKEYEMKGLILPIGTVVTAVSLTYGLGIASASSNSPGGGAKVGVASSKLGRILVDGRGRTLYLFEKDKNGRSTCSGVCAGFWPPLVAKGGPLAWKGAKASLLGTTRRADGHLQVTYDHHPLFAFVKDTSKG